MSKIDDKVCGMIHCVRYDVESPLCDFCYWNMMWDNQHSTPSSTISDDDCRDVGRSRPVRHTSGLATTNPDRHP